MKRNKFYASEYESKEFDSVSELIKNNNILVIDWCTKIRNLSNEHRITIEFKSGSIFKYSTTNINYFQEIIDRCNDNIKGIKY